MRFCKLSLSHVECSPCAPPWLQLRPYYDLPLLIESSPKSGLAVLFFCAILWLRLKPNGSADGLFAPADEVFDGRESVGV